jgi:hypothetical protein
MGAHTTQSRTHEIQERRSLPPSRDPLHGVGQGMTPGEGPSLPDPEQDGRSLYWVVLHCSYEANAARAQRRR